VAKSIEIRLHGRGGQGGVTCAKLLAAAYAEQGLSVQTFGDYAGERSGAPVRAYTRVSDAPITNRNKVYSPDQLLVLEPSLLGADVVEGLAPGGTLLLNTSEPLESFAGRFEEFELATVDATGIARRHGIGTRTMVIVNTTIAGAYAQVHGIPLEVVRKSYEALGLLSNFDAAVEAYGAVTTRPASLTEPAAKSAASPAGGADVLPIAEHVESGPTGLQTGSWSTQRPVYVENLAPCNAWCPAGNDVVNFVQAVARDGEEAAARVLRETTPLAAVCGRVCAAPCMEGCNRREVDGAVNIRGLERWIADQTPIAPRAATRNKHPRRVAIVGGGPAGLSAAYTLARAGHAATILEGEAELGGVLRTGIPSYRLPRAVLDREVDDVLALGVDARCGEFLNREKVAALEAEFDALILATGLQRLRGLDVPGAELAGVEQGLRFLHRVNLVGDDEPLGVPGHVVVLGGGNTAMDCARSALRSGAERVTVAYRRTHQEMPAIREEIEEAEHEGVRFLMQRQPVAFVADGNGAARVQGVELADVVMGEPDDSGRRRPIVTDSTSTIPCDAVLLALGQSADHALLPDGWELRGEQVFDEDSPLMVFGAGDLATGDGTVTHALGSGRRAAGLALRALGEDADVFERPDRTRAVPVTDIRVDHFAPAAPTRDVLEAAETRTAHYDEVNHGLPDNTEAHRCFSCGHCTECDTCLVYCPEGIIRRDAPGYGVDYSYCKGCGVCVEECPRRAMEMSAL
jgi:2-oxoacid:acceptor oxidoreductase gamma subunit (pyruvate/2-ketoisovalerate family)/2-oxoacid:acceptor oxidoreductase delta subunit (pyruvate/2-ketoisovalerate family)